MSRKLFSGPKLRRFREQRQMKQAEFAASLGISPSYLNQIENNQRPLTATVLLKLSSNYQADLQAFSDEDDDRLAAEIYDVLSDPLFQGQLIDLRELKEVVSLSPVLVNRFITLYRAYQESINKHQRLAEQMTTDETLVGTHFPYEEVRDFFYAHNNTIPELDQAAEQLQAEQSFRIGQMEDDLTHYLSAQHHINRVLVEADLAGDDIRRFDAQARTLALSERQPSSRRAFYIAYQIGLLEHRALMDEITHKANFVSPETAAVCRVGLANYFAAALLMPYTQFLAEAKKQRYDLEKLELRFGVTFEAVCHRLSSLQRPGAKGIPFYFVRVDKAGNISKRQSASRFHFARSGGACPLWNVHDAFSAPGKILTQLAQMPDGKVYFCIARTVTKAGGGYLDPQREFAIGLGCDIEYANQLVYSAGVDLDNPEAVVPIGPSCRVCERIDCAQRAFPPIHMRLSIDENRRSFKPYLFERV